MSIVNKQILRLGYNNGVLHLSEVAAKRIKEAREAAGLTQADLADYLGLSRNAISKIEVGKAAITIRNLEQLPKILNHPIEYFLGLDTGLTEQEHHILAQFRALPTAGPYRRLAYHALASLAETARQIAADETPPEA